MSFKFKINWKNVDYIWNKVAPKKFIAFIIASVMAFTGIIDGQQWLTITMIYMGANAVGKLASGFGKKEPEVPTNTKKE